jgi:protein deglycase
MKKVLILLANGFEEYMTFSILGVLGHCKLYSDIEDKIDFETVSLNGVVKSFWDMQLQMDKVIDNINVDDYDALIIPGGFEEAGYYDELFCEQCQDLIKGFNNKNKYLISICVGSISIARTGILKGRNATTYNSDKRQEKLREYGVILQNDRIVVDNNIISSNSPATSIDVAFMTIELLTSKGNSDKIKGLMGFDI